MIPSPGMLDHLAMVVGDGLADDAVVQLDQFECGIVAHSLGKFSRSDDVGEHHAPYRAVIFADAGAGDERGTGGVHLATAKEAVGQLGIDLDDLVGGQAMRLAMGGLGGLGTRGLDQAKCLAAFLVEPIFPIVHAMLFLNYQVGHVGMMKVVGAGSRYVVNIEI